MQPADIRIVRHIVRHGTGDLSLLSLENVKYKCPALTNNLVYVVL